MIKYTLRCGEGHVFEDWFASSAKYDALRDAEDLKCPECGTSDVSKTIMAPNVSTTAATPTPTCGANACSNMGCPAMQG